MLTIKQRNVLCALEQHDGRLSLRMPCQRFGWLSTSTPQGIVAQLMARGFVRRLPGHTGVEILRSAETVVWRRQRYFRFDATSKKLVEFTPAAGVAVSKRKHTHCKVCERQKPAHCKRYRYCSEACWQAGLRLYWRDYYEAHHAPARARKCRRCAKFFISSNGRWYCSPDCRQRAKRAIWKQRWRQVTPQQRADWNAKRNRRRKEPEVAEQRRQYLRSYGQRPDVWVRRKTRRLAREEARKRGLPLAVVLQQACYAEAR